MIRESLRIRTNIVEDEGYESIEMVRFRFRYCTDFDLICTTVSTDTSTAVNSTINSLPQVIYKRFPHALVVLLTTVQKKVIIGFQLYHVHVVLVRL